MGEPTKSIKINTLKKLEEISGFTSSTKMKKFIFFEILKVCVCVERWREYKRSEKMYMQIQILGLRNCVWI